MDQSSGMQKICMVFKKSVYSFNLQSSSKVKKGKKIPRKVCQLGADLWKALSSQRYSTYPTILFKKAICIMYCETTVC